MFRVHCRLRPPEGHDSLFEAFGETSVRQVNGAGPPLKFDGVFDTNVTQADVYAAVTQSLVADAVAKDNQSMLFCYGVSGAGKTRTVFGASGLADGLVGRALTEMLAMGAEVSLSAAELYGSRSSDLLQPPADAHPLAAPPLSASSGKRRRRSKSFDNRDLGPFLRDSLGAATPLSKHSGVVGYSLTCSG